MNDYHLDPNYAKCTEQEQRWFDHFFESRDMLAATYTAYRVKNDDSARAYGRSVIARAHIKALIDAYCTQPKPMPTLEDLKRLYLDISELPSATPGEKLKALNSYERLCGFDRASKDAVNDPKDEYDPLDDLKD